MDFYKTINGKQTFVLPYVLRHWQPTSEGDWGNSPVFCDLQFFLEHNETVNYEINFFLDKQNLAGGIIPEQVNMRTPSYPVIEEIHKGFREIELAFIFDNIQSSKDFGENVIIVSEISLNPKWIRKNDGIEIKFSG
jgi:hypothetical protein